MLCFCVMLFAYTSITLFDRTVAVRLLGLRVRIPPATCCVLQESEGGRSPFQGVLPSVCRVWSHTTITPIRTMVTWKDTGLKKLFESAVSHTVLITTLPWLSLHTESFQGLLISRFRCIRSLRALNIKWQLLRAGTLTNVTVVHIDLYTTNVIIITIKCHNSVTPNLYRSGCVFCVCVRVVCVFLCVCLFVCAFCVFVCVCVCARVLCGFVCVCLCLCVLCVFVFLCVFVCVFVTQNLTMYTFATCISQSVCPYVLVNYNYIACTFSVRQAYSPLWVRPFLHTEGPGSTSGQSKWDFWWTQKHWEEFHSQCLLSCQNLPLCLYIHSVFQLSMKSFKLSKS
jgi:hypothetical protein